MTPLASALLQGVGYLEEGGGPSDGMLLSGSQRVIAGNDARLEPLMANTLGGLRADAVFKVGTAPVIIFKSTDTAEEHEVEWHRLAWNFGVAPLLWVTTPQYVRIYNAYQPPESYGRCSPLLGEFSLTADLDLALGEIAKVCGRRHVAMGGFWRSEFARTIDRRTRVDNILLRELTALLKALMANGVRPSLAQKLVGRCIFFQYLVHRGYVTESELESRFGGTELRVILTDLDQTYRLFQWIRTTFNGDLFPIEDEASEREQLQGEVDRLAPLSDFFGYFNVSDRQGRLFPFRFDAIPVELISSIYEKFVHMADTDGEPRLGVHYTPINLVDLVLDPVFEGLSPSARVLDPACGSGVFLVESLRRLVWLRSQNGIVDRALLRKILMRQLRGIDISPAALSVAAFSLYLALLELDPAPPRGIEALNCLKFEPLLNKVLFPTSAFDPSLTEKLLVDSFSEKPLFDAIVGNPPWTHDPAARAADREIQKRGRVAGASLNEEESPGRRSGVTYARLNGLPLPPRSNDWAFLWRCRDFALPHTRIALVMKSTPFFSREHSAADRRDRLLRAFPSVSLVNMAQLRLSGLFQDYEGEIGDKAAAGPALLFLSNCLPTDPGTATVINLPWTPTFQNTGIFELPSEPAKALPIDLLARRPELLKAAAYGEERDVWFLEKLAKNPRVTLLRSFIDEHGLSAGQGFQPGTLYSAEHLTGLRRLSATQFRALRLPDELPIFTATRAYRAYDRSRYEGPLVVLPEGGLTAAVERGRYTAAFDRRTIVYNESFVGLSFADSDEKLARALVTVMNSSFVAYQLALTGCTLGIKQTKVERVDLNGLWLPRLGQLPAVTLQELVDLEDKLANGGNPSHLLERLDNLVYEACGFTTAESALLEDAVRRAASIIFETPADRCTMDTPPLASEINAYARHLCTGIDSYAEDDDDLVLVPEYFAQAANDLIVMRFALSHRESAEQRDIAPASLQMVAPLDLSRAFGGPELPYLKPLRTLRLYVGDWLLIIKPARYRCFTPAAAWSDSDRVISDLMGTTASATFGSTLA